MVTASRLFVCANRSLISRPKRLNSKDKTMNKIKFSISIDWADEVPTDLPDQCNLSVSIEGESELSDNALRYSQEHQRMMLGRFQEIIAVSQRESRRPSRVSETQTSPSRKNGLTAAPPPNIRLDSPERSEGSASSRR